MHKRLLGIVVAAVAASILALGVIIAGHAPRIENGDFETGGLEGWGISTSEKGTFKDGNPTVVLYDTNNDGTATFSAYVTMGHLNVGDGPQSAGIFQTIHGLEGDIIGPISVDIAADTSRGLGNTDSGLFELLIGEHLVVEGKNVVQYNVVDFHDFGLVRNITPEFATLNSGNISLFEATILIRVTRDATVPLDLDLYIDNVVQGPPVGQNPVVEPIIAPGDPVQVETIVEASASFTDVNSQDTHTGEFDWGDGTTSAATVTGSNGSGSATGTHTYHQPGVFTVTLTVTDSTGASGSSIFEFVVVYDPDGAFVTGGGWIDSPAGAYAPDPSRVGRANFGFVSKYKKGANTPTGQTQFRFKVADLTFQSDVYDWLVVAGARAKFKGSGSINNAGSYGFMLSAVDGDINAGNETDKFRIKIWDKSNSDSVVYDNQAGSNDDDDPTTEISGGSIVIHE